MGDEVVSCPYSAAHRVKLSRLQYHLVRCAEGKAALAVCEYNATHRMPQSLLDEHVARCPDRPAPAPAQPPRRHGRVRPMLNEDVKPLEDYWD